MRGIYLSYEASGGARRKLVARLEDHVILPRLTDSDVLVQVRACALSWVDPKTFPLLHPGGGADQLPVGFEVSGTVAKVGAAVQRFAIGDSVAGCLPLDTKCPGCAEYCILPEYCLVHKPQRFCHVDCAATLSALAQAHSVAKFLNGVQPGTVALVFSGASVDNHVTIQMLLSMEVKVIACVSSSEEAMSLNQIQSPLLRMVDLSSTKSVVDVCLQETGGLGVGVVLDNGVAPSYAISDFIVESASLKRELEEDACSSANKHMATKYQIISCLATGGHWVTLQPDLQLDPPEAILMHLRGASLHFLFPGVWSLSGREQGVLLGALQDLMTTGLLPCAYETACLEDVPSAFAALSPFPLKRLVVTPAR